MKDQPGQRWFKEHQGNQGGWSVKSREDRVSQAALDWRPWRSVDSP